LASYLPKLCALLYYFAQSNAGLKIAGCQWPKGCPIDILEMAGKNKFELPSKKKRQVK
jgi:hypothetical protein